MQRVPHRIAERTTGFLATQSSLASRPLVPLVLLALSLLFIGSAQAQDEGGFPAEVVEAIGAGVLAQLDEAGYEVLSQACGEADSLLECLRSDADAQAVLAAAGERAAVALVERFGEPAVESFGEALIKLDDQQLKALAKACRKLSDDELLACFNEQLGGSGAEETTGEDGAGTAADGAAEEAGAGVEEGGAGAEEPVADGTAEETSYSEEALALLPKEVLDALPKLMTNYLEPEDYTTLKEACPQEDIEQVVECLGADETSTLLENMLVVRIMDAMLTYMDAELPNRLQEGDYTVLSELCDKPGTDWANCAFEKSPGDEACSELEDGFAACLVDNDIINEAYLAIVEDKKGAFGEELYAELAGLLAVLPLDGVKALREACGQNDMDAAIECILADETVGAVANIFYQTSEAVIAEAETELTAAGKTLDKEEYTEKVFYLFLTVPTHTIQSLATECEKSNPSFETLTDPSDIDAMLACIQEQSMTDPVANPAFITPEKLKKWIEIGREKVAELLLKQEEQKQSKSFDMILVVLLGLAGLGFFGLLLMPLFLKRKYPGQDALLWKASAVAATTFAATVVMLGVTLMVMRTTQGAVAARYTSPKMQIADATFNILGRDENVQGFSELSKAGLDFIKTPLRTIVKGSDEELDQATGLLPHIAGHWVDMLGQPEFKYMAKNASMLKEHAMSFKSAIDLYKKVDWLMGILPILLSIIAVLLYLLPMKETLVDIASAPARAAAGVQRGGSSKGAKDTIVGEVKLLGPFLLMVLLLLPLVGAFLTIALEPIVELVLGYSMQTVLYIVFSDASGPVIYLSLAGVMLLLVLGMLAYMLTMSFFLGTARKILREVFHEKRKLSEFKRFFTIGLPATLWTFVLPLIFFWGLRYIVFNFVTQPEADQITSWDMLGVPLLAVAAFPVFYYLGQAWRALKFVKAYPVKPKA